MINKGVLADIVASNIKRGVSYTYVLPKESKVAVKKEGLKNTYGNARQPPEFVDVPPDLFDNITETNITIYNPVPYKDAPPSDVFIELPTDVDASKRHWVKVHPHFGERIIGKVNNLIATLSDTKPESANAELS
jgi:hypothetical protein